jgi:hypothetical protein
LAGKEVLSAFHSCLLIRISSLSVMQQGDKVPNATELLRQGRRDEIWKKYCGFLDLSLAETMQIQKRLLLEQLHLLGTCELGRQLLGGRVPTTVEEFRQNVPLTRYQDYAKYLLEKRDDALPRKPRWWVHSSGRTGEYEVKWVPYSAQWVQRLHETALAILILSGADDRGDFVFEEGDTMLYAMAPFPYMSGAAARGLVTEFAFRMLPSLEEAEDMDFQERVQQGFRLALKEGLDSFNGVASVLLRIGEQFAKGSGSIKLSADLLHPQVIFRLARAMVRSRLAGRKYLLPRDLWTVKGIATGGTDVALFRRQIQDYWGRSPLEGYASTESGFIATQLWDYKSMTFFPDVDFLEFIPEDEAMRSRGLGSSQARTVTLAEVKAGERYELVLTNFLGGVFTRYRTGDLLQFTALRNEALNVDTPQMVFYARADDLIDLASFAVLTERTIWQALEAAGLPYVDWMARKEYEGERVSLHIYLEPKDGIDEALAVSRVRQGLGAAIPDYADLQNMLGLDPLRVTLLKPGTFRRYTMARQAEGTDLGRLKPAHMNAPDGVVHKLLLADAE